MRKNALLKGLLGVGLEDADPATPAPAPAVAITVNVNKEDGVEDAVEPIAEAAETVEDESEAAAELEDGAATLEGIATFLEQAVQDGGLQPQAVTAVNIGLEAVAGRLGISGKLATPSLESFSGSSNKLRQTQVSLETVKETMAQIWQAIKNAVLRGIKAVADFIARLLNGVAKLKARATTLREEAKKIHGKQASGKIKVMSAGRLTRGGVVDGSHLDAGLEALHAVGEYIYGDYVNHVKAFFEEVAKLSVSLKTSGLHVDKTPDEFITAGEKAAEVPENLSKETIGGYRLKSNHESADSVKTLAPSFIHEGTKAAEDQEVTPLTADQIDRTCNDVLALVNLLEGQKGHIDGLKSAIDGSLAKLDELAKSADKGIVNRAVVNAVMRGVGKAWSRPLSQYGAAAFSVSRSALIFCERSIAAHA